MKWLAILLLSGCAVGAGGSNVGAFRPKRVIETTACVESSPGVCGKTIDIGNDQPERSFGGGIFSFTVPGYAHVQGTGISESAFVLDNSYEYFRGRGHFAVGGRVGITLIDGQHHGWIVLPVTAMGYYGGGWGNLYAGVGYSPLAVTSGDNMPKTASYDGVQGLLGLRLNLTESLGRYITFAPELRYQRVDGASIITSVGSLCLHF